MGCVVYIQPQDTFRDIKTRIQALLKLSHTIDFCDNAKGNIIATADEQIASNVFTKNMTIKLISKQRLIGESLRDVICAHNIDGNQLYSLSGKSQDDVVGALTSYGITNRTHQFYLIALAQSLTNVG